MDPKKQEMLSKQGLLPFATEHAMTLSGRPAEHFRRVFGMSISVDACKTGCYIGLGVCENDFALNCFPDSLNNLWLPKGQRAWGVRTRIGSRVEAVTIRVEFDTLNGEFRWWVNDEEQESNHFHLHTSDPVYFCVAAYDATLRVLPRRNDMDEGEEDDCHGQLDLLQDLDIPCSDSDSDGDGGGVRHLR